MTWLITGAAGQLGLAIQKNLSSREIPFIPFNSHELNITNHNAIKDVFERISPTVVVNCAAWTDVDGAETNIEKALNINALGPQYLALTARDVGAKLVHISTDYVFSGERNEPWPEDGNPNPTTIYGKSKLFGENSILDLYPEASYIVRTAWLYSAGRKNFARTMSNLAMLGDGEVKVVEDQIGQPTSANDLAKHIVDLVLSESIFDIYHGTNSGATSWFGFAQEIFRLLGADVSRVISTTSDQLVRAAIRPRYSVLGHDNWIKNGLPEMRDWQSALIEEIPLIIELTEQEMKL